MDFKQKLGDFTQSHPGMPTIPGIQLPSDIANGLNTITQQPGGFLNEATSAYCATQHPELYTYAALGGVAAGFTLFLVLWGLCRLVRGLFGRGNKAAPPAVVVIEAPQGTKAVTVPQGSTGAADPQA